VHCQGVNKKLIANKRERLHEMPHVCLANTIPHQSCNHLSLTTEKTSFSSSVGFLYDAEQTNKENDGGAWIRVWKVTVHRSWVQL